MKTIKTDCGVIGGGLAGCTLALELADAGKKVDLFVKGKLIEDCNSFLIAGGLAAVPIIDNKPHGGDSIELHVRETLKAGKNLNNIEIVRMCAEKFYPDVIQYLIKKGVKFDRNNGFYDLHREGGHSKNRIFHFRDTTGVGIMQTLGNLVKSHRNIRVHEFHMAIDIVNRNKLGEKKGKDECLGFYVYDINEDYVKSISCKATFIATGGLGKVFLYTSNPDVATGDGFAMCYRAGLKLVNMEFIQFHPTVFYDEQAEKEGERIFLLTEALRGAGAFLKLDKNGKEDFVLEYDPLGSRATRDVVSRAEDVEMRKNGLKHLWLDCTKINPETLKNDFKNSYEFCLDKGFDLTKESVPVIYAEHYSNGGIEVDENSETAIKNCYVLGETSYTGLHGATRLASNSGPECVLFARIAAAHFIKNEKKDNVEIPLWDVGNSVKLKDRITVSYYWEVIRRTMNALCGMSRDGKRLEAAKQLLESVHRGINDLYWTYRVTKDFLEVRNIADVASVIVESALGRKESRACHFREDFPKQDDEHFLKLTIIQKDLEKK
jgi:L-aspartate oxidase